MFFFRIVIITGELDGIGSVVEEILRGFDDVSVCSLFIQISIFSIYVALLIDSLCRTL